MLQTLATLVEAVLVLVALWFSIYASPLDGLKYRWATWMACAGGLAVLRMGWEMSQAPLPPDLSTSFIDLLYIVSFAVSFVGLLLRHKLGVLATVVGHAVHIYRLPSLSALSILSLAIYACLQGLYFYKRWPFLTPRNSV
jgi:hypothetical protein